MNRGNSWGRCLCCAWPSGWPVESDRKWTALSDIHTRADVLGYWPGPPGRTRSSWGTGTWSSRSRRERGHLYSLAVFGRFDSRACEPACSPWTSCLGTCSASPRAPRGRRTVGRWAAPGAGPGEEWRRTSSTLAWGSSWDSTPTRCAGSPGTCPTACSTERRSARPRTSDSTPWDSATWSPDARAPCPCSSPTWRRRAGGLFPSTFCKDSPQSWCSRNMDSEDANSPPRCKVELAGLWGCRVASSPPCTGSPHSRDMISGAGTPSPTRR